MEKKNMKANSAIGARPPTKDEMTAMVEQIYRRVRSDWILNDTVQRFERCIETTNTGLKAGFGLDLSDPVTLDICVRMYAAMLMRIEFAKKDGLDASFAFDIVGATLGAPNT